MVRRDALLRLYNNLLKRREEIQQRLKADLRDLGGHGASGDMADAALDTDGDEISSSLAERESEELAQVDHAIERLKAGTYGMCEGCVKRIPVSRLNAVPFATLCIDCQRAKEEEPNWEPAFQAGKYTHLGEVKLVRDELRDPNLRDLPLGR
ncbi:MAG: TraR/DksA family transcriptional regulator [Gemmataceae bacterium]